MGVVVVELLKVVRPVRTVRAEVPDAGHRTDRIGPEEPNGSTATFWHWLAHKRFGQWMRWIPMAQAPRLRKSWEGPGGMISRGSSVHSALTPQTLGIYEFVRKADDPPAVVYAGPLRHNHTFYSRGVGQTWVLKTAGDQ